MKKLLVAAVAAGLAGTVNAQSAFEGFYGQIATGYESNSVSGLNGTYRDAPPSTQTGSFSGSNQTFGGAPLVIGIGYNFAVSQSWLLGIGVDYSALSQTSSNYSSLSSDGFNVNGSNLKVSNRFNIFLTPGYVIDKEKLLYAKAGYSSAQLQAQSPTTVSAGAFSAPISPTLSNPTATISGFMLGLGYKQVISGGFYGFAEGNYASYSSTSFTPSNVDTTLTLPNVKMNSYQLLVGVGYRF